MAMVRMVRRRFWLVLFPSLVACHEEIYQMTYELKAARRKRAIDCAACFVFGLALSNFITCIAWMVNT